MTREKIKIVDFDATKYLKTEEHITEYLKASLEMNDPEVFLSAKSTAAKARDMNQPAQEAEEPAPSL